MDAPIKKKKTLLKVLDLDFFSYILTDLDYDCIKISSFILDALIANVIFLYELFKK